MLALFAVAALCIEPRRPVLAEVSTEANEITCDTCKEIVEGIDKLLDAHTTQEEIIKMVEFYCSFLPQSDTCKSIIEEYIPLIIQFLEKQVDPVKICGILGYCKTRVQTTIDTNALTCDVCKDFVRWTKDETEKYTVPAVWKVISQDCPKVPYIKYACKLVNEQNIQTIVDMFVSKVEEDKVCGFLHACNQ